MSDKPEAAYDTGGSAFDATRDADAPVSPEAAAAEPAGYRGDAPPPAHVDPVPDIVDTTSKIPQDSWDRAVGTWIGNYVRSSPIAQGATGAWEHLHAVLPHLKDLLEQEIKG